MGKYMRKRTGRPPAAELAQVVVGVRTRSRSAAFATAAAANKRPRKQAAAAAPRAEAEAEAEVAGGGDGGGRAAAAAEAGCYCYLQLRSRRLFMASAAAAAEVARCAVPAEAEERTAALLLAGEEARSAGASSLHPVAEVAGVSRCSSTASAVDVVVTTAGERSRGAAEAREDPDVESSVSDSAMCVRQGREATPSSRPPPAELSDEESSQAAGDPKQHRRPMSLPAPTAAPARRARTPAEEEVEEFFAAAEKAEAERFAAKYNFDVARDLPLDAAGGRFEWTTVAASG